MLKTDNELVSFKRGLRGSPYKRGSISSQRRALAGVDVDDGEQVLGVLEAEA